MTQNNSPLSLETNLLWPRWADRLTSALDTTDQNERHQAARLLELFADEDKIDAIEAAILDPACDRWMQVYLLRIITSLDLEVRAEVFDAISDETMANQLRLCLGYGTRPRALFAWAVDQERPAFQYTGMQKLLALDGTLPGHLLSRAREANVPLIRMLYLQDRANAGHQASLAELVTQARGASHVVLRAQALACLRALDRRPADYLDCMIEALQDDEVYDAYYQPAVSEAALGLGYHADLSASDCIDTLVTAAMANSHDESWWAFTSAIESWRDGGEPRLNSLWFWSYLERANDD